MVRSIRQAGQWSTEGVNMAAMFGANHKALVLSKVAYHCQSATGSGFPGRISSKKFKRIVYSES